MLVPRVGVCPLASRSDCQAVESIVMSKATHRITLLPDGVEVSDREPVRKRSRACYDTVSPSHIPDIQVCILIRQDTEMLAIKIPSNVLDKIPVLEEFHAYAVSQDNEHAADPSGQGKNSHAVVF